MKDTVIKEVSDERQWNEFLLRLEPNTFLQSWEWGQVQQASGEKTHYLSVYAGAKQVGAALVITVNARRGRHYLIPHGPIFTSEQDTLKYLPSLITHLKSRASQAGVVAIRIAPLLKDTPNTRAYFQEQHFRPAPLHVHAERVWLLDLTPSTDTLLRNMRKTTRHAIKKAVKAGVVIDFPEGQVALQRFMPLYHQTKQRHHFVPSPSRLLAAEIKYYSRNKRLFAAVARHQGKDVAAAILIQFGSTVFYHHGASATMPSTVPASQLLQFAAISEARKRGATRYNFWGIAPDSKPHHPFAGITIFKQGFGGYSQDYLHAQDLPLSPRYWQLWAVESWRRLRRGF